MRLVNSISKYTRRNLLEQNYFEIAISQTGFKVEVFHEPKLDSRLHSAQQSEMAAFVRICSIFWHIKSVSSLPTYIENAAEETSCHEERRGQGGGGALRREWYYPSPVNRSVAGYVQDKTFGMKNKKGKKAQEVVKNVQNQVSNRAFGGAKNVRLSNDWGKACLFGHFICR